MKLRVVLLCLCAWVCAAHAQQSQHKHETILHRHDTAPPAETQRPLGTPGEPDAGEVHGDLYTNEFFGFSYTLPNVMTTVTDVMEGQEDLSGRAVVLLSLESDGEPGKRPAALTIAADKLTATAPPDDSAWATAYLKELATLAAKHGAQALGGVRENTFGGRKFFRQDFQYSAPASDTGVAVPAPGFQTTLVSRSKGYALIFTFAAETRDEIDTLVRSLESLKFSAVSPRR